MALRFSRRFLRFCCSTENCTYAHTFYICRPHPLPSLLYALRTGTRGADQCPCPWPKPMKRSSLTTPLSITCHSVLLTTGGAYIRGRGGEGRRRERGEGGEGTSRHILSALKIHEFMNVQRHGHWTAIGIPRLVSGSTALVRTA